MKRCSLLLLATLAFGCAHYNMACPHDGGPAWVEVTSPHFTLRTDMPAAKAETIIRECERIFASFVGVVDFLLPGSEGQTVGRTSLVLFESIWEYRKVRTGKSQEVGPLWLELGVSTASDERGRRMILMSADAKPSETFRHELTHRLLRPRLGQIPRWLNEGLAEYFAQSGMIGDKLYLGAPSSRLKRATRQHTVVPYLLPLAVLSREDDGHDLSNQGYLSSWMLVHYLANGAPDHADRFRKLLVAVANGRPAVDTMIEMYGPLPLIEKAYVAHAQEMGPGRQARQWILPQTAPTVASSALASRWLDDGEVHLLKAWLRPEVAGAELEQAESHAGASATVHGWRALLAEKKKDDASAVHEIEAALKLQPADQYYRFERARLLFERALQRPKAERHLDELETEMRAVARHVEEPRQLELLARYFGLVGDDSISMTLAARAVALDPQCAPCLVTLAGAYAARGDLDNAVGAQEAAVLRWPDRKHVPADVTATLAGYKSRRDAGAAPVPPPAP
jgi:tetratricopeptide (TPR) repeat protein